MEEEIMGKTSEFSINPSKGIILIEADPFVTILEHVLSHQNTPVLEPFCVGGLILGSVVGEDVVITEIVPLFHGTQDQMEFMENYQNALLFVKGRKTKPLGWYYSRLNAAGEFTKNILPTHQFFQNMESPKAFSLIINPYPDEKLPITMNAYRFHNIQNTTDVTAIKSVDVSVKSPSTTQIYQKVQRIIENFQSLKPIHQTEIAQTASTLKSPVQHLLSSSKSTIPLLKIILEIVTIFYQGLNSNAGKLLASLNAVIRNMQSGFSSVMQDMDKIMKEESRHILETVDQNFEKVHSDGDYLSNSIAQLTDKISMDFGQLLKNVLEPKLKEFKGNLVEIVEESAGIEQKIEMFTDSVKGQQTTLETFKESLEKDTSSVEDSILSLKSKLKETFSSTEKSSVKSIEKLQKEMKKIEESLNKIEKMMKD